VAGRGSERSSRSLRLPSRHLIRPAVPQRSPPNGMVGACTVCRTPSRGTKNGLSSYRTHPAIEGEQMAKQRDTGSHRLGRGCSRRSRTIPRTGGMRPGVSLACRQPAYMNGLTASARRADARPPAPHRSWPEPGRATTGGRPGYRAEGIANGDSSRVPHWRRSSALLKSHVEEASALRPGG